MESSTLTDMRILWHRCVSSSFFDSSDSYLNTDSFPLFSFSIPSLPLSPTYLPSLTMSFLPLFPIGARLEDVLPL